MTQNIIYVSYAILCAINDIKLGIARSYYMDWAMASGYKKSTAGAYWSKARKLMADTRENPGTRFMVK